MLVYIIFTIITFLLLIVGYAKIKYGFWISQPVFHIYDLSYYIFPPGIIQTKLPTDNKYTNFKDIQTIVYSKLSANQVNQFLNFIQTHFLQSPTNTFSPTKRNLEPYFHGHNTKSFISFYTTDNLNLKKGTVVQESTILGVMTSRPIHILFRNTRFDAYYVDYLCVDKSHRKMGIAPQIIQTHHYNQSHINPNISVSLFKRENNLTGIVPLCVYKTYGFHVTNWRKPHNLPAMYSIVTINSQNYHLLLDFISLHNKFFDVNIITEPANVIELLKTGNLYINVITYKSEIICAYFFKNACVTIDANLSILTCIASINGSAPTDLFVHGFKISFWYIAEENKFGFSAIENISHNHTIINNICKRTTPTVVNPTAYFFYNFACHTVPPEKMFVIC